MSTALRFITLQRRVETLKKELISSQNLTTFDHKTWTFITVLRYKLNTWIRMSKTSLYKLIDSIWNMFYKLFP